MISHRHSSDDLFLTDKLTVKTSNFHFPEDLLPELLSRLPVKTLISLRLVSKAWRDLIQSESFAKLHLNRLPDSNYSSDIVVRSHFSLTSTSKLYAINCNTKAVKELHYPPLKYNKNTGVQLLGSSNGVLCLHYAYQRIVLWNPLSLNYWELLRPRTSSPSSLHFRQCAYGFGYDRTTDDYKVVALAEFVDGNYASVSCDGQVYSLKLKRWKRIENFSYHLRGPDFHDIVENGVLVGGALHWITRGNLILAFDLADEKFCMVLLPNNYSTGKLNVGSFGDYLSLTCRGRGDFSFTMWVMKDYGVKDSWIVMNLKLEHYKPHRLFMAFRSIGCLKSKSEVIFTDDLLCILLYDLERQSAEKVAEHVCLQVYGYLETLECFGGSADDTARKSSRHKRTRRAKSNEATIFMDRDSVHQLKRMTL